MKAIIITSDGLQHKHVANSLSDVLGDSLACAVIETGSHNNLSGKRLRKLIKQYGIVTFGERVVTKTVRKFLLTDKRRITALSNLLPKSDNEFRFSDDVKIHFTESANNRATSSLIKSIAPDYIFVYGSGIIKDSILDISEKQALNLHTGISPEYRGSSTDFWCIYNNELNMLGVTVHECTSDVDGGEIFLHANTTLEKGDDVFTAFAKVVITGAAAYSQIARALLTGQKVQTIQQNLSTGREYKFKDKTFAHEIAMEFRTRFGSLNKHIEASKND